VTFQNIFLAVGGIRRGGSAALDLAYLAAGRPMILGRSQAWDVAAGSLLVQGLAVCEHLGTGILLKWPYCREASIYPFLLDQVTTPGATRA
jgi:fructose-1,6-bisphosphatase/inositol monophosphatase family enzyme